VVYLTPELRGLLAELERVDQVVRRIGQIIPWLFPYLRGRRRVGQRRRSFAKAWAKACERAKVPGRILHDFRRPAVRNLERAGIPWSVAMKVTGHKTESVYRRYAIVGDADFREAPSGFWARFRARGGSGALTRDPQVATMPSARR
jgi:integrase